MKAINLFPFPAMNLKRARAGRHRAFAIASLSVVLLVVAGCGSNKPAARPSSSERSAGASSPSASAAATRAPDTSHATSPPNSEPRAITTSEQSSASGWQSLFDGKTLIGWRITEFGGHGEVGVEDAQLVLHTGAMLTGVSWTNELPKTDYEVQLEARKIEGGDFFCGLTFPVGDSFCSYIVGGWGGGVVGLSSIDGMDASENQTTKYMSFPKDRWFRIKLRVTPTKIQAWIDDEQMVDQSIVDRKISLRGGEIYLSQPFGIATWQTTGALRNIRLRRLTDAPTRPAQ